MPVSQIINNRPCQIGVLAAFPMLSTFIPILQAITDELQAFGYAPICVFEPDPDVRMEKTLELWKNQEILGAIHIGSHELRELWEMPAIIIGQTENGNGFGEVSIDNIKAGRRVGQHLWELGHRSIGVLMPSLFLGSLRTEGLRAFWLHQGGSWNERYEINWNVQDMEQSLTRVFTQSQTPTGLFCFNDHIAATAIQILTVLGKRVPEDVSVVGFDDMSGIAAENHPPSHNSKNAGERVRTYSRSAAFPAIIRSKNKTQTEEIACRIDRPRLDGSRLSAIKSGIVWLPCQILQRL